MRPRHGTRIRVALLVAVSAAALAAPATAGLVDPEPVRATRAFETQPAGAVGYLAWTQGRPGTLWVKPDGEPRFRINPRRTSGFVAGGAIDGTRLVYYGLSGTLKQPNIHLYNLVTKRRSNPPAGVNTRRYSEYAASRSGDWLLFARRIPRGEIRRVFLFNLATRRKIKLDESKGTRQLVQPGSVNGNWAVWTRCRRFDRCATFRYDIAARTQTKLPNPRLKSQYAASVTGDGTVYFAESATIFCGNGFGIWRFPIGGPRERLTTLPRRHDAVVTSPVVNPDTSVTVFFDRINCRTNQSDIYKITISP